ncbi:MAG: hypothetical protein ABSG08_01080 [Terriglobales bacterium]|jgi:hypothetical protein
MIDHSLAAELRASFNLDDDTLNLELPPLPIDRELYKYESTKSSTGNRLAVAAMENEFRDALLGTVEQIDETTGQLVEKTFATVPTPPRQLPKPATLTKTSQAGEYFDDLWIGRAYKVVNVEYRNCGSTAQAMQQAMDLFSDQLSKSECDLFRGAVASLNMTSFLQMLAAVLKRTAL